MTRGFGVPGFPRQSYFKIAENFPLASSHGSFDTHHCTYFVALAVDRRGQGVRILKPGQRLFFNKAASNPAVLTACCLSVWYRFSSLAAPPVFIMGTVDALVGVSEILATVAADTR